AKPPTPPGTVSTVAEIETYLDDLVAFGTPPGLTVVVVKDGEIRYTKGFGLADAHSPTLLHSHQPVKR
ncbi:MAG: hypothetical protein VCC01_13295, partial [Candidatus Hydrogenedentota bacterium]